MPFYSQVYKLSTYLIVFLERILIRGFNSSDVIGIMFSCIIGGGIHSVKESKDKAVGTITSNGQNRVSEYSIIE